MATTDAKSGFRLPWSADRNESDAQSEGTEGAPTGGDPTQAASQHESPTMTDTAPATSETGTNPSSEAGTAQADPGSTLTRKPNKFMADLTKAMQTAAEAARADTLERFGAEAKAHIESIHASTADEATELRKKADDDIAGIREWSKTEIARIREETDERIAHRKSVLEREIETHAGQIEERIERVQQRVAGFENDMASFFERLLSEEDPTRFASMAESLPEPPPFDADAAWDPSLQAPAAAVETPIVETPVESAHVEEAPAESSEPELAAAPETFESTAQSADESVAAIDAEASGETEASTPPPVEEVPSGWGELAAPEPAEAQDTSTEERGDAFAVATEERAPDETDPRLEALGLDRDFAAAEAEAGEFPTESETPEEEIPTIADDALAARLAGLVPETAATGETATTRVVVTGLVSVASIAGFKRNLARVSGVHSVGVTSGPDGEFVFAVTHDAGMALGESIATLPGFGARVTNEAAGELTVTARDPEAEG